MLSPRCVHLGRLQQQVHEGSAGRESALRQLAGLGPTFDRHLPVARVDPHHDAAREARGGVADELRVAECHGAEDHAVDAGGERGFHGLEAADAAAELDGDAAGSRDDPRNRFACQYIIRLS